MNYLNFKCDININDNPLDLNIDDFLEVAVRNNPKRRFLFISKTLGKHLACRPTDVDDLGKMIASIYSNKNLDLKGGTVISFAETATCIGHSVFDYLNGDYEFIHTTREELEGLRSLDFLETHSHATNHNLYFENLKNIENKEEVILVDDEITTANTCINLIKEIQNIYPKKKYTICSVFNWVSKEDLEKIRGVEQELDCIIDFIYLFKGDFKFSIDECSIKSIENRLNIEKQNPEKKDKLIANELEINYISVDMDEYVGNKGYVKYTGAWGLDKNEQQKLKEIVKRESSKLKVNGKTLFLGTEEFMYIPMLFAKEKENLGEVYYHSTTRSPIIESCREDYPIKSKFTLNSFYNNDVVNYVYNIDKSDFSECFLFVELNNKKEDYSQIIDIFKQTSIKKLNIVCCSQNKEFSTYCKDDVVFLLKDISDLIKEEGNKEREIKIQNGRHYSEMIPIEYEVSEQYLSLYYKKLNETKERLAFAIGLMCEKIIKKNGRDVVLVSLARAGTPIGILAKRYLKKRYNLNLKHYTVSIIRDKGIDMNAMRYIVKNHPTSIIQFIDGWTGKGTISRELDKACLELERRFDKKFDSTLAVLADPGGYSSLYGVREDFLIPSACLNSTVSGLISRTVLRDDIIGENDFHGAKFYSHLKDKDESMNYIKTIEACFECQYKHIDDSIINWSEDLITRDGDKDVFNIKERYNVRDINFIKPGVGETTRVLIRRVPDKILVRDLNDKSLQHIFVLANEKNVIVEQTNLGAYRCCGVIKSMKDV